MQAEPATGIVMIRHKTPARRNHAHDAVGLFDISRPMAFGMGPDRAETMIPWLKTSHRWRRVPWLLYARFKGESWIHCIASTASLVAIERAARDEHLQSLATWFDLKKNRTHARFSKGADVAGELVVAGNMDVPLEVVSFQSSAHPKTLFKRCSTTGEAVDSFFAALDAQRRDLAVIEDGDGLELRDVHGRAFLADELDELAIRYYAPVTAAESPASARLLTAIESGDVELVRRAIAEGASVEFLPDVIASPLSIVLDLPVKLPHRCPKNWRDIARSLVESGADIDGYEWESPPICSVIHPMAEKKEGAIIDCVQAIQALGGDINATERGINRGATPLHLAVYYSLPEVAHFLIEQGASLDARDGAGLTPLESAESSARDDRSERLNKVHARLREACGR